MAEATEEIKKIAVHRNPAIEAVLANSQLAIEYAFGLQCLTQYLTDLSLLSSGASYKDLGISERRAATFSQVISLDASGHTLALFLESPEAQDIIAEQKNGKNG